MTSDEGSPSRPPAVAALIEQLGLQSEPAHLLDALTHPSYANEQPDGRTDNQRLEFLGDAVIGLCISELLMDSFGDVDEGALTVMRSALVNANALADAARRVDLGDALRLGRGADSAGERQRTNVLADGLEAVVGAIFLDLGLAAARDACERLLGQDVAALLANGGIQRDAKSRLQELLQAEGMLPPVYEVVLEEGAAHARTFTVRVVVRVAGPNGDAQIHGAGRGTSKKLAEQAAAGAALTQLRSR